MKKFVVIFSATLSKLLWSFFIFLPPLLLESVQAQDSVKTCKSNAVTVSLHPLIGGSALVSYERVLPFRSSVEAELGVQGFRWEQWRGSSFNAHTRPGYAATVGYKFFFPFDKKDLPQMENGVLVHTSWYLKLRLAYVHQWSSYDIFVGNQGWDILTERHTYHEQDLTLAFICGFQYVGKRGFIMSPFFGYNMPLIVDGPFHTKENPGTSAAYAALLTAGVKLGWAF
ncbi:MAG: hypothetical protein IKN11_01855 [Bacteroidales bacterium]|nr:hypothetical protein [Bacteroidales bacterium]